MAKLIIQGGQIPHGEVQISGAKNSATRLLCAALLSDQQSTLSNFPTELVDAKKKLTFLNQINVSTTLNRESDELVLNPKTIEFPENTDATFFNIPVRTTYLFAAPQLMRFGKARIPYPGGCKLGDRKYDLHIMVWEKFGCEVQENENYISILCKSKKLQPCEITFPITTIGGTENALLCASTISGKTIIKNAYVSPEVNDLIQMLRQMGVTINLLGTSAIEIIGNNNLLGVNYKVMPDRIETLTWLIYGILSGGKIFIKESPFNSMEIPLIHIYNAGIDFFKNQKDIFINQSCINQFGIQPFELACGTYPGIISDMQPFFVLLATKAQGRSLIIDYRYPNRTAYVDELNKMLKNKISYKPGEIIVNGPSEFYSSDVNSTDLRGSMAVILAALLVKDKTFSIINDPDLALRGYNKLLFKLENLGIKVCYEN